MLKQTDYAKFIQASEIIIWDECPMMHRHAFEALDRSLRDIMGAINPLYEKIPFGKKSLYSVAILDKYYLSLKEVAVAIL